MLRWRDWTTLGLSSKYSVLTALLEKEKYFQATPLHLAARRESSGACQSDMFASLLALLATALAKPDSAPNDSLTDQQTMHVDETSHLVQRLQVSLKSLRSRVTTALGKRIVHTAACLRSLKLTRTGGFQLQIRDPSIMCRGHLRVANCNTCPMPCY